MTPEKSPHKRGVAGGLPMADFDAYLATTQDIQRIMASGVLPDGSLRPDTIRALLKAKGIEIKALAELAGLSDQYFHQVINRSRKDARIEDLIADRLGIHADRVWGRKVA